MKPWSYPLAIGACLLGGTLAYAQADKVILRLEPGGPASALTAVAFSPDGERLYAAGYDKVVRVWAQEQGTFKLSKIVYRVPVGPGYAGTINALAVSPDGTWLAAGGFGVMRGRADFRSVGMVVPALGTKTREKLKDEGSIFVFNVNNERAIKVLRGHAGVVRALAFLPARDGKPPLLVSAADEPTEKRDDYSARVRLWDVAKAASLAEETLDVDTKPPRKAPGLTAWHTGPDPKGVAVAVAWQDGQVRVWDVAREGDNVEKDQDGQNNTMAAPGTAAGAFWTASFERPKGVVRLWQPRGEQRLRPQREHDVPLLAGDDQSGPFYIPRDLATFSSRRKGPIDRAVVLARRQGETRAADDQDFLFLLDLPGRRELARVLLGNFPLEGNLRRVAVSPTGAHIAVADADHQQVRVFATADLQARPQVLRGVGTSFRVVSFRKQGADQGLYLQEDGAAPMLFDFTRRRLSADAPAWPKDSPDPTGWRVDPKPNGRRPVLTVSGPNFPAKEITLAEGSVVTAGALLPPRKGAQFGPLLAVGWLDANSQARLALYDVRSVTEVRQLAGHVGRVRSLAFSSDGRLLASAADDQTVCLWSMTSLGQVLGKAGALRDVVVIQKEKTLVVAQTPAGSPLEKGTVVEGFVEEGKLRRLTTPLEFHSALFEMKPGAAVVLRTRPPGAATAEDVKLTVGQGTDERKPLLSLFVTRAAKLDERHWIAWTSMGPYDASSRRAEDYLGWHFNPDKRAEPIAFVRADKYRKDYEKKGILEHVVRRANVAEALKAYENVRPELEGAIDGIDPRGPRVVDRPLVRNRALTLRVEIPPPFSLDRVSAMTWQMDEGPWMSLGEPRDRQWSAELAQHDWGRGPHSIRVRLETDNHTRQLGWTNAFHYLPEPPHIELSEDCLRKYFRDAARTGLVTTTKEPVFHLAARVRPGTLGEKVRVTLRHNDDPPKPIEGLNLRQQITLRDGKNVFAIRAVNAGASKDLEAMESAELVLCVYFNRRRPAPQIVLREVVPLVKGAKPLPVHPAQAVQVPAPKVRVVGRILGEENLQEAKRDGQPLPAFEAGKQKQFDFEEELTLKPGEQVLRYEARSANSPGGKETLRIVYQPPVARIDGVRPTDESTVYQEEVEFQAKLVPPDHNEPYTAEVLVNGRPQAPQRLDAGATVFKAKVKLQPEANRVVVRLYNQWGAAPEVRELQVRYLRLPVIVTINAPRKVEKEEAVLDSSFSAVIKSPADLPPTEARLNDKLFRTDRLQVKLLDRAVGSWKVTLRDVELNKGDNTLTLFVANKDGESQKSATVQVLYTKLKPRLPIVRFRDFKDSDRVYVVAAPKQPLAFVVESETPLRRVELRGEGDKVVRFPVPAGALKPDTTHPVQLQPGKPTTFRLLAGNDGGEAEAQVTLHWPQPPLYVEIERLESVKTPGRNFPPSSNDGQGRAVFDKIPEGQVKLHGRIYWNDSNAELFRKEIDLRVYANGFQQIPARAELPAPQARETKFSASVLLTHPTDNRIEIDLPKLKMAEGQRNACVVHQCTDPVRGRRLHVVMVGIGEKDAGVLKQRALKAIGAKSVPSREDRWHAPPAFEVVVPYEPLVGGVSQGDVIRELKRVKLQIEATAGEAKNVVLSDVVLLYYQGREVVTHEGRHYLETDDSKGDADLKRSGVDCELIVKLFSDARGAQVVMLDVERIAVADALRTAKAFDGTRLGVFHFYWLGGDVPVTRLLDLVRQCWGNADNLRTLAQEVAGLVQPLAPQLQFYRELGGGDLALLEFGGKP